MPGPSSPGELDLGGCLEILGRAPEGTGLFCDFDGTLAPIVDDPAAARPLPAAAEALDAAQAAGFRVAVISGRPVAFLTELLPPSVDVFGVYGLEWRHQGELGVDAEAERWAPVIDRVAAQARAELPAEVGVEAKRLSLTLHFRTAPGTETAVESWAGEAATTSGLEARSARRSVELHPPVAADKGTALLRLAGELGDLTAACFFGDDLGDLTAFDALDRLGDDGIATVRIAVASSEAPAALLDRADLVVDGPEGVAGLIAQLAARS